MAGPDALGRATFEHIAPQAGVRPTNREVRWLSHIERHGPQSSTYLHELTRETHRCRDTSLRQLKKLRAGGFLHLPRQQRATEQAEFNPYIYDLTPKARDHLFDLGISEPAIRPTGHWVHSYMAACVTASIDIAAGRKGIRYIPAHQILAIQGADLAIPVQSRRLIPDQLFALDYGGRYRAFALEVDRGTEPKTSRAARKSLQVSVEQYAHILSEEAYKRHYGLKATLLVLWVFSSRNNEARFLDLVGKRAGPAAGQFLTKSVDGFHGSFRPPQLWTQLLEEPWQRAVGAPVSIGAV